MNRPLALALALLAPLFVACNAQVVSQFGNSGGGGQGGGSDGNSGGSNGAGGDNVAQSYPAVAMSRAKNEQLWDDYWATHGGGSSSSSSSGGNDLDPNDLFLHISDLGTSCSSPTTELSCGGHWEVTLVVPPAMQHPGTIALDDPALVQYSIMSETGPADPGMSGECSWGGGSLGSGTLELISLDDAEVRFHVTLTGSTWDNDPSGEYTAIRCQ
ncbi:MAG: hypothetical protein U0359_20270 [Byssovorax sp.]